MRYRLAGTVLVAVSLAACNSGSPRFMGAEARTVTVEGSTFVVRRKDDRVELIRTNREAVFWLRSLVPRAGQAVVQATGCDPKDGTWTGDPAMMQVQVECP